MDSYSVAQTPAKYAFNEQLCCFLDSSYALVSEELAAPPHSLNYPTFSNTGVTKLSDRKVFDEHETIKLFMLPSPLRIACTMSKQSSKTYTLTLTGDVMIGRLIDGLFPNNASNAEDAQHCRSIVKRYPQLRTYDASSPWGSTLSDLQSADLTLINLETPLTTFEDKWPEKVFNYRAHPDRIDCLKSANVAYAGLANNHILDFGVKGMEETVRVLESAGIKQAGAGETSSDAVKPAVLHLPKAGKGEETYNIHVWAASDHPSDWAEVSGLNLIDYSQTTRARLKEHLTAPLEGTRSPDLKIISVHWGPNYSWHPAEETRSLAHFLIDECGIDIVHGHSSHHVQGVEVYQSKLIIYGCGDFVDDYAVNDEYRNDLSAVWRVRVEECDDGLRPEHLEILPTKIERFQAQIAPAGSDEHAWVCSKVSELSRSLGMDLQRSRNDVNSMIIPIK